MKSYSNTAMIYEVSLFRCYMLYEIKEIAFTQLHIYMLRLVYIYKLHDHFLTFYVVHKFYSPI